MLAGYYLSIDESTSSKLSRRLCAVQIFNRNSNGATPRNWLQAVSAGRSSGSAEKLNTFSQLDMRQIYSIDHKYRYKAADGFQLCWEDFKRRKLVTLCGNVYTSHRLFVLSRQSRMGEIHKFSEIVSHGTLVNDRSITVWYQVTWPQDVAAGGRATKKIPQQQRSLLQIVQVKGVLATTSSMTTSWLRTPTSRMKTGVLFGQVFYVQCSWVPLIHHHRLYV